MTEPTPELEKLMRLKRYERPPEGYFDDFLREFHERQRSEVMRVSSFSLFLDRLGARLYEFRSAVQPRWLYGMGAACALLVAALYFREANPTGSAELAEARKDVPGLAAAVPVQVVGVLPLAREGRGVGHGPGAIPVSTDALRPDGGSLSNGLRRTSSDFFPPLVPLARPEGTGPQPSVPGGQVIILVR